MAPKPFVADRLELENVLADEVAIFNALYRRHSPLACPFEDHVILFSGSFSKTGLSSESECRFVTIALDEHPAHLQLPRSLLVAMLAQFGDADALIEDAKLAFLLLSVAFEPALKAFRDRYGRKLVVKALASQVDWPQPVTATTTISYKGQDYEAGLLADLPFCEKIAGLLPGLEKGAIGDAPLGIPVRIRVEAGTATLSFQQLKSLELDDVVVLDRLGEYGESLRLNVEGAFVAEALLRPDGSIEMQSQLARMSSRAARTYRTVERAALMTEGDVGIDDFQVNVSFQLGELQLAVGELSALQPGYVFTLPTTLQSPVTICANGQPIGRGEIVRIGDIVGVRVIRLFGHER